MRKSKWHWTTPLALGLTLFVSQTPLGAQTPPGAPPPAPPNPIQPQPAVPDAEVPIEVPKAEGLPPGLTVDQMLQSVFAIRAEAEKLPPSQRQTLLYAEAVKRCAEIYAADPTNIEAMLQIGEISMQRNDTVNGREYFSRVVRIEGKNYRANRGMGEFYLLTRYYRQAVPFLEVAVEAAPQDKLGETYRLLAAGYYETRYFDQALETINEAFKLLPDNPLVADYRARVLLTMLKLDEANAAVDQLIAITRRRVAEVGYDKERVKQHMQAYDLKVDVLTALHNTLHKRNAKNEVTDVPLPGKEPEIAKVLNDIVATRAAQLPVINTLALLEVIPLCNKAVAYEPSNVEYLKTLARVCVEARLYGDAIATLERMLQVDPTNAWAREALGQLQAEINAMQRAAAPQGPSPAAPTEKTPPAAPPQRP